MRQYMYELAVVVITCCAILHGIFVMVADIGRPAVGYSSKDRAQLNWLVMKHTRGDIR